MAVTEQDLRHVAALARLGLTPERVPALLSELNGILAHMDVLARVNTSDVDPVLGVQLRRQGDGPVHSHPAHQL